MLVFDTNFVIIFSILNFMFLLFVDYLCTELFASRMVYSKKEVKNNMEIAMVITSPFFFKYQTFVLLCVQFHLFSPHAFTFTIEMVLLLGFIIIIIIII